METQGQLDIANVPPKLDLSSFSRKSMISKTSHKRTIESGEEARQLLHKLLIKKALSKFASVKSNRMILLTIIV